MTAMFDTLKFARTLRAQGRFTPDQAEGLADAFAEAIGGEIAGRADLKATEAILRGELHDSIAAVRIEMRDGLAAIRAEVASIHGDVAGLRTDMNGLEAKIEVGKSDTIKRVVGIIGFQSVAVVGAAVVLARYLSH